MKMFSLEKTGFDKENINSYGNMFLIGNGHLGYRGTLEEYSREEMVGLNVVGFYDQYKDKWRESVNMPNPFKVIIKSDDETYSVLKNNNFCHKIKLDIRHAIFHRETQYHNFLIKSERFVSSTENNLILFRYKFTNEDKDNKKLHITLGMDKDIFEINGPHFAKKEITYDKNTVIFKGITNEGKTISEINTYYFDGDGVIFKDGMYSFTLNAEPNKEYTFYCYSKIDENGGVSSIKYNKKSYSILKKAQINSFEDKWKKSYIKIKGNERAQFALNYSLYHLLILGSKDYETSIPARGVSGSVYKGAIFWDTEIFMVPFFTVTDPVIARKLLKYRINTLPGAKAKAIEYGYKGAFYAWESQEYGQDGCSKYNVTDPVTGKPIRTYFNEKQIHIDADIVYALENYMNVTGDYTLLSDGALDVMNEVSKFFMSYSKYVDGKYHLLDVIGPDEYHERIDDNAFTSHMAKYAMEINYKYLKDGDPLKLEIKNFLDNFYTPIVNENKLIEQFTGYFDKEDTTVDIVRSRLRNPKDYWGGKNGVATPTRVIKQADVIALLVLLHDQFDEDVLKANFDFYYPYTEHGSSLSSSMYSIIASRLGYTDIAYNMFLKSAEIDLGTNQKMYAGGIYIGGTHPASNGGAYLSLIYGMAGLELDENGFKLNPHLPNEIQGIEFSFIFKNKEIHVIIDGGNNYKVTEEQL